MQEVNEYNRNFSRHSNFVNRDQQQKIKFKNCNKQFLFSFFFVEFQQFMLLFFLTKNKDFVCLFFLLA